MIRKRGSSYEVRVYNPAEKKKVNVGTKPTLREARELERQMATEFSRHRTAPTTVRQWAERWLELYPRSPQTTTNYTYSISRLVDEFGDVKLREFDRITARQWAVTHQWRLTAVRAFFNDAIDAGVCFDNPFARLGLSSSRGRRDLVVLDDAELERLIGAAYSGDLPESYAGHVAAAIRFAACTAIRPGELFALEWENVRLDELEATIAWQITQKHGRQRPKRGVTRDIVVPPPARDALLSMPRFEGPHVFASLTGKRLTYSSHHDWWSKVRDEAGWFGMDFYELRHYGATKLLALGMSPEEVAVQMGHHDGGKLVREVYGHPSHAAIREKIKQAWVADGWQDPPEPAV